MRPLLRIDALTAGYGAAPVLHGVDMHVHRGEIVAVVGANGAGKSTLLGSVSGLVKPSAGTVQFDAEEVGGLTPQRLVRAGLAHVPEGRRIFRGMNVLENLQLGLWACGLSRREERERITWVQDLFPFLATKLSMPAEALSGGEQQMLVVGQALMSKPRLLLLDEPSLGLAPIMVDRILETVALLRDDGLTVLLVEQVVDLALGLADRGYVMQGGRVVADGPGDVLIDDPRLRQAYLGAGTALGAPSPAEPPGDEGQRT